MCTAIISVDPSSRVPVLVIGVRDEFLARDWVPPGRHWPDRPGLVGGRDLRAGGTWLAVDPAAPRVGLILNGRGEMADEARRASRGGLPLRMAADGKLGELDTSAYDPFHLVGAEPDRVRLWSWDGIALVERVLGPGLHMIVNSGLEGEGRRETPPGDLSEDVFMGARLAHFRPRFAAAARPEPGPDGGDWGEWLALVNGGGIARADHRALLPLLDVGTGERWGTTSVSLVALWPGGVRYDFRAVPGDPDDWTRVL